jgi:hypothetical protein
VERFQGTTDMAKMKMNVDWKQFFIQKGERIGVIVAGVLAVLMILPTFGFMLFGQNSKELVTSLSEPAKALKQKQDASVPSATDKPDTAAAINSVITKRPEIEKSLYPTGLIETPRAQLDLTKRQVPFILVPVEGTAGVSLAQVRTYVLADGGEKIMKLAGVNATGMGTAPGGTSPDNRPRNFPGAGGGPGGRGGYSGYRSPYAPHPLRVESVKDFLTDYIPVTDIGSMAAGDQLADMVLPTRVAIVECSFPYRKQIEEFQHKLHLPTPAAVMNEQAVDEPTDPNATPAGPRPTFYFKPPRFERRRVDVHGSPLEDWKAIDPAANWSNIVYANGGRFEPPDDEWLDAVSFENMAMPKLALMGKNQYPNVASQLPELQKMIAKLKADKLAAAAVKKPNPLADAANNVNAAWSPRPKSNDVGSNKTGMGPNGEPGRTPKTTGDNKITTRPPMNPNGTETTEDTYPDYCLIRMIDVTIQPGEYYEYRLKVRMANPNFGKKNVASPAYAESAEPLEAAEWFEVGLKKGEPKVVAAPPEYHLYAVDQEDLDTQDNKRYTGQNAKVAKERRAVFQIHKWLLDTNTRPNVPVGEWSVAERVLVHRGEYIGIRERVEVPYWRSQHNGFVLVPDEGPAPLRGAPPPKGIFVDFGLPLLEGAMLEKPYPILVDYEGGEMSYDRVVGKDEKGADKKQHVSNKADTETLILSPDGKLLAMNSGTAKADAERIKRLKEWHERIDDVRRGINNKAPGGSSDILGGPQPPKPMP